MIDPSRLPNRNSYAQGINNTDFGDFYPVRGQISYVADMLRPKDAAKLMKNLHYIDGVWTSEGTGWRDHKKITEEDTDNTDTTHVEVTASGVSAGSLAGGSVTDVDLGETKVISTNTATGGGGAGAGNIIITLTTAFSASPAGHTLIIDPPGASGSEGEFNSGAEFLGFGIHYTTAGTAILLMQVGDEVYDYDPTAEVVTEVETSVFTAGSSSALPTMRSYSPGYFIYTNGFDQPKKWAGTGSFATLQGDTGGGLGNFPITIGGVSFSKPKFCEVFNNRLVLAKFDTLPFHFLMSEFDDPQGYDTSGTNPARANLDTVPAMLGPIKGMKSFKLSNDTNEEVLLIGCENGFSVVTGIDADTYRQYVLTTNYGLLSNYAFEQLDSDLLFFATDGIRSFSTLAQNANLLSSSLSYPIQDVIRDLSASSLDRIFSIHHPETLEVLFWFPRTGESHNRNAIVANYGLSSSNDANKFTPAYSIKQTPPEGVARSPSCGIVYAKQVYCGGYDGHLQVHYEGNKYDTEIIQFQINSSLFTVNTPTQNSSARKFYFVCQGGDQEFTAAAYVYEFRKDGVMRKKQVASRLLTSSTGGSTILGGWILGSGVFASRGTQFIEFTPPGSGHMWEIEARGNSSNASLNLVGVLSILIGGGTRQ